MGQEQQQQQISHFFKIIQVFAIVAPGLVVTGLAYNFATFLCAVWRTHWWIVIWSNWHPGRGSRFNIILKKGNNKGPGEGTQQLWTILSPHPGECWRQERAQSVSTQHQEHQDFIRRRKQEHRRIINYQRVRHRKVYKRRLAGISESIASGVPTACPLNNPSVGNCRAESGVIVCTLDGPKSPSGSWVINKSVKATTKNYFSPIIKNFHFTRIGITFRQEIVFGRGLDCCKLQYQAQLSATRTGLGHRRGSERLWLKKRQNKTRNSDKKSASLGAIDHIGGQYVGDTILWCSVLIPD